MKTLYTTYNNFAKRLALVLTLLLTLGVTTAWAAVETVDFSQQGYENGSAVSSYTGTGFSVSFAAGTNSNAPKYYSSGDAIRCYGGNKFTVTSTSNITKVVITFGSSDGSNAISTNVNSYSSGTWEGTSKSITFTIGGTSGNRRIQKLSVTYESGYSVTYNNGGRGTAPSNTTASSVKLSAITATGYTNTGWKADVAVKNGSTTIEAGDLINNGTTVTLSQATTFTAQWTPKQVTITWNANGGIVTPSTSNYIYDGSSVTLPTPTRDGYNFKGWYTSASGGTQITDIGTNNKPASDVTYYAQWTEKELTNYRTSCSYTCTDQYTFDYGGVKLCFSQVDESNEYQITDFTIPETTTNYWVGYNGYFYDSNLGTSGAKSANNQFKYLPIAYLQHSNCEESGYQGESYQYAMQGAYGKLRIYDNYPNDNLFVGFIPAGYQMRYGTGENWANFQLFGNDKVWTSEVMDITAELVAKYYYINIYSGATFNANDAGVAINHWTDGSSLISSMQRKTNNGDNWANGVSAGMRGFFRTWVDNCYANGYCHFVPTHRIVYVANWPAGATGVAPSDSYSEDVSVEESKEITLQAAPTAPAGYIFSGWYDAPSGGNLISTSYTISAGATADVTLYAQWKQIASLSWSAPTCTVTIASESNVFPTLTATPEAIKSGIKYSSSDPAVATIDANGNIILKSAGTTTIKAYYEEDATYAAAEATYELTVEVSTNCRWEEVTIDEIEYGDEVVIATFKNEYTYALKDGDGGASSAPPAVEIKINQDNTINTAETTISNALIWNIDYDKEGTKNLVINSTKNTGKWLYSINNNNGIRIGDNTDKEFKIVEGTGDDAGNFFLYHIAQSRYLGVYYTNPDWRGYTTINTYITGQTLKFYKKVCLPNNISLVSYSVGDGDVAPAEQEVENNNSINLPALTTNLTCVKFVGWTDAATYTHGTSSLYKAGDSYTVTQNVTFHAVYAAGGGFVLVTDANDLAAGDRIVIAAAEFDVAMGAQNSNNRAKVDIEKDDTDNTITTPDGIQFLTLEEGTSTGTYAFNTGSGYLYAASSSKNYLNTQTTNNANGSWTIEISAEGVATIKAQGSNTRNWLRYNSTNNPPIFSCYASGQADVSIYKESVTGYTTNPECVMYNVTLCTPANGTISVDKTIVDPYGSTILTFAPATGYMLDAVTITSGTAEVGTVSYTSNQTSGGTVKISNIQSDIEVCATFVEIPYYKVTFVDMNADPQTSTEVFQSEFGGDITAPTTASDGCDVTWTFIGWAPSNSLNGTTEVPANLVEAGGTISGANITNNNLIYYSVYSNSSDGTPPFSIGKSGTYYMYALDGSTKYYATTNRYGSALNAGHETTNDFTTYPKAKVKLTYNLNTNKYKIQITTFGSNPTDGYLLYHPDKTENDLTHNSFDNYTEFTLQQGNALGFNIVYAYTVQQLQGSVYVPVEKTGCFGRSSNHFQGSSTTTDVYFEPASEIQYYNAADCGDVKTYTMSFHNPFGDEDALIWYDAEHEKSYYTDKPLNTSIDVFPTMVYNGWAFIGWTANQQYNELIGDDNLDDENSATNDPTSYFTIYSNTAGWAYTLNDNVTMYPVFTKFEDNEPFDMVNGGDYYIYYIADGDIGTSVDEYGAANRIYAGGWGSGGTSDSYGATQSCASATLFTFTKLSNGKWSIYDNTKGRYLCAGATDNNLALNTTTATYGEWTITVHNGNQVNAVSKDGYTLSALSQDATSGTFKNYATSNFNNNGAYYHRIYVGSCTERVYSSNPSNKPKITLNGTAAVTSTKDQTIRSEKSLSISAMKLAANGIITLTADNEGVYFSTVKDANFTQATKQPLASLPLYADEKGKLAMTTVYVHYKPTSTSTPGVQTANITATTGTNGQPDYATATTTAALRNLPADFVIAAKWGDNWYALPANMDSQSSTEGLLIEVDDAANPTKAIAAPNTTKYGVKSVYTSNSTADRYADNGERLVFVENVEETTPVTNKTLYNGGDASGSKTNIQVYAQYANYYSDQNQAPRYEWIPTTTDLTDYTLTSGAILSGDAVGRTVSLDNHGIFGTLLQDKSYNGMVRLLPVDNFYGPAELQVVEWKQKSVSVMYTGAGTKYTTKVGNNAESDVQSLSKIDHAVYTLSTGDLTTATNQPLIISIKDDADATIGTIKLTIPWIVDGKEYSTDQVASEVANATEIVILDNATLTATDTKYTFHDITVYPGGSLVIGANGKLGMNSLTMRAGSSWGALEYENKYPQFVLNNSATGAYSNTSGQINLDYVTTQDYYYPLSVPEEVTIGDIKYPVEIYGSNVEKTNKGSFQLKYYDGAQRVAQGSQYGTGWVVVNEKTTLTLIPNQGYAIWGIPKKINGTRQTYGIHRIPIKKAAGDLATNEKTNAEIPIKAHGINDANVLPNDKGWNYLGNPYLAGLGGMDGTDGDLQMGLLVQEVVNGQWTGGWVNNGEQVRYVTLTNDCQTFEAKPVAEAQIPAFTTFFIQAAQDGAIALTAPAKAVPFSIAARQYAAQQEAAKEITTGILLTGNDQTDRTGLLIADNFTEEYEFNADLSKFENSGINLYTIGKTGKLAYMAINQTLAEQPIPVGYSAPAEGLYTIAFDEDRYNATDISALYLIDYDSNEKTNLLHTDYSFVTAAGTNNQRFALQVAFAPENATNVEWVGDATVQVGVEGNTLMLNNLPTDAAVHVFDALGRLMYHAPTVPTEMQLTLPTGYYLVRIADKQHAVVIKTVIP